MLCVCYNAHVTPEKAVFCQYFGVCLITRKGLTLQAGAPIAAHRAG